MYPAEPPHNNPTFFVKKNTMSYPLGLSSTDEVSEDDLAALAGQERLTILDQEGRVVGSMDTTVGRCSRRGGTRCLEVKMITCLRGRRGAKNLCQISGLVSPGLVTLEERRVLTTITPNSEEEPLGRKECLACRSIRMSPSDSGGHKLVLTEWRIFGGQLVRGHNNAPLEIELPSLKAFKGAGRHHQQVFLTDTSLHLAEKLLCLKGLVTLPGGVRPGSCCPYRGHVLPELLTLDATGHLVPFGLEIEEGRRDENGRPTLVSTRSSMLARLSNGGHHLQRVAGGATVTRMNLDGQMLERTITTTSGFVYYLKRQASGRPLRRPRRRALTLPDLELQGRNQTSGRRGTPRSFEESLCSHMARLHSILKTSLPPSLLAEGNTRPRPEGGEDEARDLLRSPVSIMGLIKGALRLVLQERPQHPVQFLKHYFLRLESDLKLLAV